MIDVETVQAVLLAVMIGDAMGQSVESMTAEEILEARDGQPIDGFIEPIQTKIQHGRDLQAGDTTDDWQLTQVVAESLIKRGGYDQIDMAQKHVEALDQAPPGTWGGTTRDAIAELKDWFDSAGSFGRHPDDPATFGTRRDRGGGNGVAMKVSPLALFHAAKSGGALALAKDVQRLYQLTHSQPAAFHTAYALACLLHHLSLSKTGLGGGTINWLISRLKMVERQSGLGPQETISQIKRLKPIVGNPEGLRTEITPGFSAITSVPYAIGLFLTYPTDFRKAVLTAVNAGGDADSTAGMVGALVAANCGLEAIPSEWREFSPHFQQAFEVGERLYNAASKQP